MKITAVEAIRLEFPGVSTHSDAQRRLGGRSALAIRIHTDKAVTGHAYLHFASAPAAAPALKALIDGQLAGVLVGRDPFLPRRLRDEMAQEIEYIGIQGLAHFALTALDTALWDVMARSLGVPGWRLLGACRDKLPAYAMVGWYYEADVNGLEHFQRGIEQALNDGFTAIKIKVGRDDVEDDLRRITAARALVGPRGILMVDVNQVLDRNEALRRGLAYQGAGAYWFEEPLRPHDKAGLAALCRNLEIPVATGENEYGKHPVRELLEQGACDILQPDARRTGGPSEWMEIAGLAAAHHTPIASHGGDVLTQHMLMATPTAIWCETGGKPKGPGNLVEASHIEGGYVYAPEAPGFGMELRAETLEKYGVKG